MPILSNFPAGAAGGVDASGYATITFHDWDLTPLGSIVVPKGEDASAAVTAFENTLKATTFDEGSQYYSSDKSKPLTNKKGYSFEGVWLDYDDETVTHYGDCVEIGNSGNTFTLPTPAGVSFANISQNMLVKAAYVNNTEMNKETIGGMNYTVEVLGYGKHGTASIYKIELRIKRENTNGQGVPRLRQACLRLRFYTDAEPSKVGNYPLIIKNVDEQTVTIHVTNIYQKVEAEIVDIYDVYSCLSSATRSSIVSIDKGTVEEKTGFLFWGTMRAVNDYIASNGAYGQTITSALLRSTLGFVTADPDTGESYGSISVLRNNLTSAWRLKNPQWESGNHPPFEDLTWDEMQYALAHAGALMPEA